MNGLLRIRFRGCCAPGGEGIKRAAARPQRREIEVLDGTAEGTSLGCWWGFPRYGKALEKWALTVDGRPEPGPSERPDVRHWPGPPPVAHVGKGPPFGAALLQHHLSLTWEGHGPQLWPLSTAYPRYRGTIRRGRCSGWGPSPASCCLSPWRDTEPGHYEPGREQPCPSRGAARTRPPWWLRLPPGTAWTRPPRAVTTSAGINKPPDW